MRYLIIVRYLIILLSFFFLFSCTALRQNIFTTKVVYNHKLEKEFILPAEFPDLWDKEVMKDYFYGSRLLYCCMPIIYYWNSKQEKPITVYFLVFDATINELIAAAIYFTRTESKHWLYKDLKNPVECTLVEQSNWINKYIAMKKNKAQK